MAFDLETETPITTNPGDGAQVFGATSESATAPSVFGFLSLWAYIASKIESDYPLIYTLSGQPDDSVGVDGSISVDWNAGVVYHKAAGVWDSGSPLKLRPRGAYSGGTAYIAGDLVTNQSASWAALQSTTGNAPPTLPTETNSYWQLIAKSGEMVRSGTVVANQLAAWVSNTQVRGATGIYESGGNVGIGTNNPGSLLTLAPIIYSTNQAGGVSLQTTDGSWKWGLNARSNGSGQPYLTIDGPADASGNTFSIMSFGVGQNVGNVGIGTTSPSASLHVNGPIRCASYTVATLPSAATVGAGSRAYVTDATATTFASAAAGGGSNKVPVYSNGTNWLIG